MKTLILLIIFVSFSLSAQVLLNTFKPLIPTVCIDSDDKRTNVSTMLEVLAEYNPELIYSYIMYLRHLSEDASDARIANQYLNFKKNEFFQEMDTWISNEYSIINSNSITVPQWARLILLYYFLEKTPVKNITEVKPNFKIDKNYSDYMIYLSYKKEFIGYDEKTDYIKLVNETLQPLIAELTDVYENTENVPKQKLDDYYEIAVSNPFLFKGSILPYLTNNVTVYLAEFLLKITAPHYTQSSAVFAGYERDINNHQTERTFTFSDETYMLETKINNLKRNIHFGGAGFSIKLRQYKSYFSNLDVSFYFGATNRQTSPFYTKFLTKEFRIVVVNNFGARVDPHIIMMPYDYSSENYMVKMTTPLIYLSSYMSINAGVFLRYINYNYKSSVTRTDTYYRNSHGDQYLINYEKPLEYSDKKFDVFPLISLNFVFFDLFDFRFSRFSSTERSQFEFFLRYTF